jgi:hypothetical protein
MEQRKRSRDMNSLSGRSAIDLRPPEAISFVRCARQRYCKTSSDQQQAQHSQRDN